MGSVIMSKSAEVYEAELSSSVVDTVSDKIREYLISLKMPKGDIIRHTMTAEEILLKLLDAGLEGKKLKLTVGKRYFRPVIQLEVDGKAVNAFYGKNENQSVLGSSLLKNLGLSPEYSYSGGINNYYFRLKGKSINPIFTLAVSLILALVIGALGYFIPESVKAGVLDYCLSPLHNVFLNVLGCIAGPMVFLSVAWGIYGIGDAANLKRIGKNMLVGYIGSVYATLVFACGFSLLIFDVKFSGTGTGAEGVVSVMDMIFSIVPKNIFSPFVDGNTLQIIFLAVVIGIAMLFLGKKTDSVAKAVEQINYIVQFLIEFISKLVPFFIFIVIVKMLWSDDTKILMSVGKLIVIFVSVTIVISIGFVIYTAVKNKVSPILLAKKGIPALLVALSTASSAAAFGINIKSSTEKYGIDKSVTAFGIPLGMVIFKPITAISYTVISVFFIEMYGIEISPAWVLLLVFCAGIISVATPPIPGGALTAYTVLFAQLGIPAEALAITLACDAVFDFINTGIDQFLLPLELLNRSSTLGVVDRSVLTDKGKRKTKSV